MINLKGEEGLTLVETIIALVLMLGLLAAFAGAMVVGLQSEVEVDKRLEASNLASSIMEYLAEGDRLENYILEFDDEKEFLFSDQVFDDNEDKFFSNLDEDLLFDIELDNKIIINYSVKQDSLYEVKIHVQWIERENIWTHNLVSLVAVN